MHTERENSRIPNELINSSSDTILQAILDNIPHLAWLKKPDGRYISVNKSFCEFHKLDAESIVGKTDFDFCSADLAEDYSDKDKKVLESKTSLQFYEVEETDQGIRYSETYKTPVLDSQGTVIGITGISRDITAQKMAEKALMESEERFKNLVTLLPEAVFETDDQAYIRFFNLKAFEMLDYGEKDLSQGLSFFDLIAKEERDRAREIYKSFRIGSELKGKEFTVIASNEVSYSVLVFTNNIYKDGQFDGIRGVMVDISRRKDVEQNERLYQSKLLQLSDTALDFLGMRKEENLYRFIGQRLSEILEDVSVLVNSYDEKENILKLEYHSLSPENADLMSEILRVPAKHFGIKLDNEKKLHLLENSEQLFEFHRGFHETSFGQIPLEVSDYLAKKMGVKSFFGMGFIREENLYGSVLLLNFAPRLKDKHFIEAFIYQSSIALHRKQLEMELIEAKKEAEKNASLKTAFLANMSHEIRTPLNGILGLTDVLSRDRVSPKKYQEYLEMIGTNGKHLLNLVNDIIDISRIEAKQVSLSSGIFSIHELLEDVFRIMSAEQMAQGKQNIELRLEKDETVNNLVVKADKSKIEQILINLVVNAIKFTIRGSIVFGCKRSGDEEVLFFVSDTGIGISEDKLKTIFDRFTQGDQTLSSPIVGSGLGLAISRGFVELMGGEIWVESVSGEGSRFTFTVPFKQVKDIPRRKITKEMSISDYDFGGSTILIVEDNIVSYKLLEISLIKTGCIVLHAVNGEQAVNLVKQHPEIDIVLMDIQLPVMNGYTATRIIKELRPELPVVAQTANAMDSDRYKCIEVGCNDFVTKPILIEELFPIIEASLKKEDK